MGYCGNDGTWLLGLGHKRHCNFFLSFGSVDLREASRHAAKTHKEPYGEAHIVTNWSLLPTPAPTCQPWEWFILKVDPSAPLKPANICSPSQHLDCNLIKDPERPQKHSAKLVPNSWLTDYKIINVYYCLKLLNFRVICYAEIDNQHKNYFNSVLCAHVTLI